MTRNEKISAYTDRDCSRKLQINKKRFKERRKDVKKRTKPQEKKKDTKIRREREEENLSFVRPVIGLRPELHWMRAIRS